MLPIVKVIFLSLLLCSSAAIAVDVKYPQFLKEEPHRKTKQRVDVSSVKSEADMVVVGDAINTIMRFVIAMSFTETTRLMSSDLMTTHGKSVLKMPPIRNRFKRYSMYSLGNWKVCGKDALSFEATFSDILLRDFWTEKYLFVKTSGVWRFDDHRSLQC